MALRDDMFALIKTHDWKVCHRRINQERPGDSRERQFSVAYWRTVILEYEHDYEGALRILDQSRDLFFSQCGYLYQRAEILCQMRKFTEASDTLRSAPFGDEIERFPGMAREAMFLYCYLLIKSDHVAPPNLLAAIPDDFGTQLYNGKLISKADILPTASRSAAFG